MLGGLAAVLAAVLLGWWLTAGQYTTVPQVAGWSPGLARTELNGLGFKVRDGAWRHSNVAAGHIVSDQPAGRRQDHERPTVTLTCRSGRSRSGPPGDRASRSRRPTAAKAAGLTAATPVQTPSTTIPAGVVISTNPVAGTLGPKNKPVGITVSAGPPLPNFVGAQVAAGAGGGAAGRLPDRPGPRHQEHAAARHDHRQSPAPGTPIQPGEVVTVNVSQGRRR